MASIIELGRQRQVHEFEAAWLKSAVLNKWVRTYPLGGGMAFSQWSLKTIRKHKHIMIHNGNKFTVIK